MATLKINERGAHTSTIEGARDILKMLRKLGTTTSPGVIEMNVKGKGKSVKLKKVNNKTFEMVVVVNSSKQTFKVYGENQEDIGKAVAELRNRNWNVQDMLDISRSEK